MKTITIEQLIEFTQWYFRTFRCDETNKVYFIISMEGYLHIGASQAKSCFAICKEEKLISCRKDIVRKGEGANG